jgi:hypothetical protein
MRQLWERDVIMWSSTRMCDAVFKLLCCGAKVAAILAMACTTRGDEVPLGPASVMRRNGAVVSGNLLKAKNGEVRVAGGIKPLDFRPGEVVAIQFDRLLSEPDVSGTVRLKYFYNDADKTFVQQKILVKIQPWVVTQDSKVETVFETEYQRDRDGLIISSQTVERKVERFAAEATATTVVSNKTQESVSAKLQLQVSGAGRRPWLIPHEVVAQPSQTTDVTIRFPTQGIEITNVVVCDVYNRPLNQ